MLSLVLLSCLLVAGNAFARSTDRDQPLEVYGSGLDGPISQNGDTLLTDVVITQGSLRIEARRATVSRDDGEVTRVVLEGAPASLQQENDDGVLMKAQAGRIHYDTTSETVVLSGAVRIDQGRDTFRGERVRYDTRNGRITGDGGDGGRIHLTIQPKSRTAAD
ncbi:lipopolysaccharide transport periplasmic protein LptA [Xanthomonadaceae bacterium XH05]|nr:lipopolysaccharide transport periplasmic protein LptA [Xanthomonadaceae bacterium XH05]